MIVAMFILGVGIAGAAGLVITASKTAAAGAHRDRATTIGLAEVEQIRGWPYAEVGIATSDPDYTSTFNGAETVTEVDNWVIGSATVVSEGLNFSIERHVTWVPVTTAAGVDSEGFKSVAVGVSWTDATGRHTVWHETALVERG